MLHVTPTTSVVVLADRLNTLGGARDNIKRFRFVKFTVTASLLNRNGFARQRTTYEQGFVPPASDTPAVMTQAINHNVKGLRF